MAADIYGWVEVYDPQNDIWDGIIKATHITYRDYAVFGTLFGIRKRKDEDNVMSIAERRGLPTKISHELKEDLEEWSKAIAPTWITWQELKTVDWHQCKPHEWWLTLFKMMEVLAGQWGEENVRLTVWFDTE